MDDLGAVRDAGGRFKPVAIVAIESCTDWHEG
jgi:hypothetical protein